MSINVFKSVCFDLFLILSLDSESVWLVVAASSSCFILVVCVFAYHLYQRPQKRRDYVLARQNSAIWRWLPLLQQCNYPHHVLVTLIFCVELVFCLNFVFLDLGSRFPLYLFAGVSCFLQSLLPYTRSCVFSSYLLLFCIYISKPWFLVFCFKIKLHLDPYNLCFLSYYYNICADFFFCQSISVFLETCTCL